MLKLVVLCCFLAAASAKPDLIAPLSYSSNVLAPAPAVYSAYPSWGNGLWSTPVVSSAPFTYSGFPHYIKKRSVGYGSFIAPSSYIASGPYAYNAYTATTPLVNTYSAAAPLVTYSSPVYTTSAHLIKKRSAPFYVPSSYVASAPYTATAAPSSFSHTSRFDYQATSPAVTTYASYPGVSHLAYSSPVAIQHLI